MPKFTPCWKRDWKHLYMITKEQYRGFLVSVAISSITFDNMLNMYIAVGY